MYSYNSMKKTDKTLNQHPSLYRLPETGEKNGWMGGRRRDAITGLLRVVKGL